MPLTFLVTTLILGPSVVACACARSHALSTIHHPNPPSDVCHHRLHVPYLIYHLFSGLALPSRPYLCLFSRVTHCTLLLLVFLPEPVLFVFCLPFPASRPVARQPDLARLHSHHFSPSPSPSPSGSSSLSLTANRLIWPSLPPPHYTNPRSLAFHTHPLLHAQFAVEAHICWQMLSPFPVALTSTHPAATRLLRNQARAMILICPAAAC